MTDFTPAATSALFPAYTGRVRTDPVDTASYGTAERKLALAKYGAYEWDNELLKHQELLLSGVAGLPVRNESGGDYAAGESVYVSGYSAAESKCLITKADADDPTKAAQFVLTAAIVNNANGYAYAFADVAGLDTSGASAVGDPVYLSDTAGGWTLTAPTGADKLRQRIGVVLVKNASGTIRFFPGHALREVVGTSSLQAQAVSYAKIVNATAQGTFIGRKTAAAGAWEESAFDGTTIEFPAAGSVRVKDGGITPAKIASRGQNLCLNPSFEKVLPGSHTTAITNLTGSVGVTKNNQFPGWKNFIDAAAAAADSVTVSQQAAISAGSSKYCIRVAATNFATGPFGIRQYWAATEYLTELVSACLGKRIYVFADLKNSHANVNSRLKVSSDGTGTPSDYEDVTGDTTLHRVGVTIDVPTDATVLYIDGLITAVNANGDYVEIDNVQIAIVDTTVTLTELPYQPRPPVVLESSILDDDGAVISWSTPSNTSWHQSAESPQEFDTDYNFNTNRPAWANKFTGMMAVGNASTLTNGYGICRYNGSSSNLGELFQYVLVVGKYIQSHLLCALGADAQIQLQVGATTTEIYIYLTKWEGDGL